MVIESEILCLMPNLSSISLGNKFVVTAPELKPRSLNSSLKSFHQTTIHNVASMNHGDSVKKRTTPVKKYSTTSEEVYPVRERIVRRNKMCVKMNVRHVKEVNKFNNKPQRSFNVDPENSLSKANTLSLTYNGKYVQTDITLNDVIKPKEAVSLNTDVPLKKNETDLTSTKSMYTQHLENEILHWLMNSPIFFSKDFTPKHLKQNIVKNLAEKIDALTPEVQTDNYEIKAKDEIDDCLNVLPMWLPSSKNEQVLFKNSLRNRLYKKIITLNNKHLTVLYESESGKGSQVEEYTQGLKDRAKINCNDDLYIKEVNSWLDKIKFNRPVLKCHIVSLIMDKISSTLNIPTYTTSCKLILKADIIDVLKDLPIIIINSKNKEIYLNRYALDLSNRLFNVKIKSVPTYGHSQLRVKRHKLFARQTSDIVAVPTYPRNLKQTVHERVMKVLRNVPFDNSEDVRREICEVILNSIETLRSGIETNINNEISGILFRTSNISVEKAMQVAKKIKLYIKIALKKDKDTNKTNSQPVQSCLSGIMSIYRSDPVTSTPKKETKKDISNLNRAEKFYMIKLAAFIRAWMDTLPTKFDDDINYKEVMINDLAGDIMDEVKRQQLSPDTDTEKNKHLNYFLHRWIVRFDVFNDINEAKPYIESFLNKLKDIPEPILTKPHHGTRQAMQNIKFRTEAAWNEDFIPAGIDVLEDQISIWMNEQPSEIYANDIETTRSKIIKELALSLQDHLRNKSPEDYIDEDINIWLNNVIKPQEREHIELLAQNLKEKIINFPQDNTLAASNSKRQTDEYLKPTIAGSAISDASRNPEDYSNRTMKEFILKYIEHNYEIEDPMARGAFGQLLIKELRKLIPPTRQEVIDNFARNETHDKFTPEKLNNVLEYIKMISDWLKNIPIDQLYNMPGNKPRVEFVNDLAKNIQEVDEQNPNEMDYDLFIASIISQSLRTYNIPILPEHKDNVPLMVNQLLSKIIANRSEMSKHEPTSNDMKEQNLSNFVDEYIRINGRQIADDEVKLEAWTARLLEEVKKMVQEGTEPATMNKEEVYAKFSKIPIPGEQLVKRFSLEFAYLKEISDWMKNLPLLSIETVPEAQVERINMMSELVQNLLLREVKYNSDINDNSVKKELTDYITTWITKLPLDPRKEVVVPILIQQLMNRVYKISNNSKSYLNEFQNKDNNESDEVEIKIEDCQDPETQIVDFIENWCNNLQIKCDDNDLIKKLKTNIARNLYQKIVELNADPRVYDHEIFKDLLEDEVDTQFVNLPLHCKESQDREIIRTNLLQSILAIKKVIDQKSTGDIYRHKLESTLDAAIPNPVYSRQLIEPGFEIYKNHLANMFILDNFDHSTDDVKSKYENRIRTEIDKYFESAQRRNALPLTRDQMYNELYSKLFKVAMPSQESVIDEVEEIKTRCEIDAWFEKLALRPAKSIYEYLEWDQILTTFAKRIHEIEKKESNPDEEIRKEISKWLQRLPLVSEAQHNTEQHIAQLQQSLNDTVQARKYVSTETEVKNKSKNKEKQTKTCYKREAHNCTLSSSNSNNPIIHEPQKRSGDLIIEIVEDWCNQLPLVGNETQNKIIKDNMSAKVVMKICELNSDPNIFNDDVIYDQLLDDELEKNMVSLMGCYDFQTSKPARKNQLKEMIKSVKFLMKQEKEIPEYKTELNLIVANVLTGYSNIFDKEESIKIKEDIVNDFVEYCYYKDNNDDRHLYKRQLYDDILEYTKHKNNDGQHVDPLVIRNQLICELSKIPMPSNDALKEIVEEIKMKNEVDDFFNDASINDNTEETEQMKKTLSKRLNDIERSGHTDSNDEKMKSEINKCLNKINKVVDADAIADFVFNLKYSESQRKKTPVKSKESNVHDKNEIQNSNITYPGHQLPVFPPQPEYPPTGTFHPAPNSFKQPHSFSIEEAEPKEWIALPPVTSPNQGSTNYEPNIQGLEPVVDKVWSPLSTNLSHQTNNSKEFRGGLSLNSFTMPPGYCQSKTGKGRWPSDITESYDCKAFHPRIVQQLPHRFGQFLQNSQSSNPCYPAPIHTRHRNRPTDSLSLNYDNFKAGPLRNFSILSQEYVVPDPSLKAPYSSSNFSQRSSMDRRPLYGTSNRGTVITPRRVIGEAESYKLTSPQAPCQVPSFIPETNNGSLKWLGNNPSVVSWDSIASSDWSTRQWNCMRPMKNRAKISGNEENPSLRYRCFCGKRQKKFNGPFCIIPIDEYCPDCGGFFPLWCKIPVSECCFLN